VSATAHRLWARDQPDDSIDLRESRSRLASGPAGSIRPLPMPRRSSTTAISKSRQPVVLEPVV
jgi:hypothetical protein